MSEVTLLEAEGHFNDTCAGVEVAKSLADDTPEHTASVSGHNAGFTVACGDKLAYSSIDLLTGLDVNNGWSIQMQPNSAELDIVDRASQGFPNLMILRPSTLRSSATPRSTAPLP